MAATVDGIDRWCDFCSTSVGIYDVLKITIVGADDAPRALMHHHNRITLFNMMQVAKSGAPMDLVFLAVDLASLVVDLVLLCTDLVADFAERSST